MIKIAPRYIDDVRNARLNQDLAPLLQSAIELEHATIPPYLCAYYSLKAGSNAAVADIIRSVVIQEMLHLTIAANLMIALGGRPALGGPQFVPDYPAGLPMGIGDNLQVRLRKCSLDQISVFLQIEEPEIPIPIPVAAATRFDLRPEYATIGEFYLALAGKVQELGDAAFTGDPAHQVVASKWFPGPQQMFAITDVATAVRGIHVIIDQGEGTQSSPFDGGSEPAHFYRFEQIIKGRQLLPRPGARPPFVYGGKPISLDLPNIWDMDDDPKAAKYAPGSLSRRRADEFNYSYTRLLGCLDRAFNGHPEEIDSAMGLMFELRLLAQQVLSTAAEWADPTVTATQQAGLPFEYQPVDPSSARAPGA